MIEAVIFEISYVQCIILPRIKFSSAFVSTSWAVTISVRINRISYESADSRKKAIKEDGEVTFGLI